MVGGWYVSLFMTLIIAMSRIPTLHHKRIFCGTYLARAPGFEPDPHSFGDWRPPSGDPHKIELVPQRGLEPLLPASQAGVPPQHLPRHIGWSGRQGSNLRPPISKIGALPTALRPDIPYEVDRSLLLESRRIRCIIGGWITRRAGKNRRARIPLPALIHVRVPGARTARIGAQHRACH